MICTVIINGRPVQQSEFEKALLAEAAWRLSRSSDVNELLAVACSIRNWVCPRMGQVGHYYRSYSEAINAFYSTYPLRDVPSLSEPALVDPTDGLLWKIDEVHNGRMPDLTSSDANPYGAKYFGRPGTASTDSWFYKTVILQQGAHPLIGTFGGQSFYE
jgi:hypothetical protein